MDSSPKLRKFRDMGSMEGLFSIFNDDKIPWGAAGGYLKVPGLHRISTDKLQRVWNRLHLKYETLQTQFLTDNNNIYKYDAIYIGCLPFKIIKCNGSDVHQLLVKELNHRFLLLNDFNLTQQDIENGNYDINNITPLYRVIFCDDYCIFNYQHGTGDGITCISIQRDFLCLINDDETFDDQIKPYTKLEDCIDPKYVISPLSLKLSEWLPMDLVFKFLKFYANNSFLRKYNPLFLHRDDILNGQYIFNNDMLRFPLSSYNKYDFNIDFVATTVPKSVTLNIKQQCKLRKVHISSVMQYITNSALIESHSDVLGKEYYKTVIGNAFSTLPLYRDPNNIQYGCHASNYWTIIEYHKNAKIGSDEFWKLISNISAQVLNDDLVRKLYKNKFPFWNMKKVKKWGWDSDNKIIGKIAFGPPTITNSAMVSLHKKHYKYKCTEFFGGANPMVGAGAPYLLSSLTIKYVDEIGFCLTFGTQFFTKEKAQQIVNKIKEKLEMIANSHANYQSKL